MKKLLFLISFFLAWPAFAQTPDTYKYGAAEKRDAVLKEGDVFIPWEFRKHNQNANCVWCAAETVCTAAGYNSFNGIFRNAVAEGWHGSGVGAFIKALKDANVPYKSQRASKDYSDRFFTEGLKQGSGVYFQIPGHALVLVGMDDRNVRVIDNGKNIGVEERSRQWFNSEREVGSGVFPILRRRNCPNCQPGPSQPPADHPSLNPQQPTEPTVTPKPVDTPAQPPVTIPTVDLKPVLDAIKALQADVAEIKKMKSIPGPQGPVGLTGAAGPAGPAGPQGPAGKGADPATITTAVAAAMANQKFTCILLDEQGKVLNTVQFGTNQPLQIKLVPLKTP